MDWRGINVVPVIKKGCKEKCSKLNVCDWKVTEGDFKGGGIGAFGNSVVGKAWL